MFFRNFCVLVLITLLINCSSKQDKEHSKGKNPPKELSGLDAREIANHYCQKCHSFPEPELLEKKVWLNSVLPKMGHFLGVKNLGNPTEGMTFAEQEIIAKADIFPFYQEIADSDWKKIIEYYEKNAPESIEKRESTGAKVGLRHFNTIVPSFNKGMKKDVTMVKVDPSTKRLWVGDISNKVNILTNKGEFIDTISTNRIPVDIYFSQSTLSILQAGNKFPSDMPFGLMSQQDSLTSAPKVILPGLRTPVDFVFGDLNQDGKEDIVISNFGFHVGSLVWYEASSKGKYIEHLLMQKPGARKSIIKDLNGDQLPDIVSLVTQGDEKIYVFYNRGKGNFEEEVLLTFPPVYGSSYFDLVDFNDDGFQDILYVSGDNSDYSYSFKPYHGIYIYLNDSRANFTQKWFYPSYGATKAVALDYDKDGDIDIAAISFFADFESNPQSGFVYLENEGNFNFTASTFKDAAIGRWLTMDAGDIDNDGDEDIVLGSYTFSPNPLPKELAEKWKTTSPYILILENKTKQGSKK